MHKSISIFILSITTRTTIRYTKSINLHRKLVWL